MALPLELSAHKTALISGLSAVAVLAVRLIAMILKRLTSGEWGRFQSASIEWGSYRIRVSRPRQSGSRKSKAKVTGAPVSSSTEEPSPRAVSSSSTQDAAPSPTSWPEASTTWKLRHERDYLPGASMALGGSAGHSPRQAALATPPNDRGNALDP